MLYTNLFAYQKSIQLVKNIYSLVKKFPKSEEYILTSQIKRAAISISLNIAEGNSRSAPGYSNFLNIAIGSAIELKVALDICHQLNYLDPQQQAILNSQIDEIIKLMRTYKYKLRTKN